MIESHAICARRYTVEFRVVLFVADFWNIDYANVLFKRLQNANQETNKRCEHALRIECLNITDCSVVKFIPTGLLLYNLCHAIVRHLFPTSFDWLDKMPITQSLKSDIFELQVDKLFGNRFHGG